MNIGNERCMSIFSLYVRLDALSDLGVTKDELSRCQDSYMTNVSKFRNATMTKLQYLRQNR